MERQDREDFQAALRRIQDQLRAIPKRGYNKQTSSWYPYEADINKAIDDLLKSEHMTLSFEPRESDRPDSVLIVGLLSLGAYTREYPLPMPADGKGPQGGAVMTRTHATGSAITYAKRYLKGMIFNLTYCDKDDDGNAASGQQDFLEEGAAADFLSNIESASNFDELQTAYFAARDAATDAKDVRAGKTFAEAKNKRYKELARKK